MPYIYKKKNEKKQKQKRCEKKTNRESVINSADRKAQS